MMICIKRERSYDKDMDKYLVINSDGIKIRKETTNKFDYDFKYSYNPNTFIMTEVETYKTNKVIEEKALF